MLVRVLVDTLPDGSPAFAEGYKAGDVIDMPDYEKRVAEGHVEIYEPPAPKVVEPKPKAVAKKVVKSSPKKGAKK